MMYRAPELLLVGAAHSLVLGGASLDSQGRCALIPTDEPNDDLSDVIDEW